MFNSGVKNFDICYLGLFPVAHKSEGLNVLLCDTIKPLINQGVQVRIHTTRRHFSAAYIALEGNGIDMAGVEFKTYAVESVTLLILSLINKFTKKKNSKVEDGFLMRMKRNISTRSKSALVGVVDWLLDLTIFNFILKFILLGIVFLIASGAVTLFIVLCLVIFIQLFFFKLIRKLLSSLRYQVESRQWLKMHVVRLIRMMQAKKMSFLIHVHGHAYAKEQIRFAKAINRNRSIKKLFFFTAFEGSVISNFKGKSLVVLPDIVTSQFPIRFEGAHNAFQLEEIRRSVLHATVIVCYSEYVRDMQLKYIFPAEIKDKSICIIPQGYFPVDKAGGIYKSEVALSLNDYRNLIPNYFPSLLSTPPVVDFTQFNYILYPTIDRPHKNTLTLLRAYMILLREKHRNLKLVLTTPGSTGDVAEFIVNNRLQYDVIYMPSVPINVLDLLFKGAALMVHPSLAEGGDIFNFSRAAAAKVPALLANVMVVREMFDRGGILPNVYDNWLFDPVDYKSLAELMDATLLNRDPVINEQQMILGELAKYGFSDMANRYLELYENL